MSDDLKTVKFKLPHVLKHYLSKRKKNGVSANDLTIKIDNNTLLINVSSPFMEPNMEEIAASLKPIGNATINGNDITVNNINVTACEHLISAFMDAETIMKKMQLIEKLPDTPFTIHAPDISVSKGEFQIEGRFEPQAATFEERQALGKALHAKLVSNSYKGGVFEGEDPALVRSLTRNRNEDATVYTYTLKVGHNHLDATDKFNAMLDTELLRGTVRKFEGLVSKIGVRPKELELNNGKAGEHPHARFNIAGDPATAETLASKLRALLGLQVEDVARGNICGVKCLFAKGGHGLSASEIEATLDAAHTKFDQQPSAFKMSRGRN